jgi:hypothetical protein
MLPAQLLQGFARGSSFAALKLLHAGADRGHCLSPLNALDALKQCLVTLGVLDYQFGFAVNGEHEGASGLFHFVHELPGVALEVGQGVNVSNINHVRAPSWKSRK